MNFVGALGWELHFPIEYAHHLFDSLFGAGAVRGFAVVLVIGIGTSMFTSLMGSRALVQVIYGGKRKVERLSI